MSELIPRYDTDGFPTLSWEDAAYIGHMAGANILQIGDQRLFAGTRLPGPDDDVPAAIAFLEAALISAGRMKNSAPAGAALGQCSGPRLDIFLAAVDPARPAEAKLSFMRPFIGFEVVETSAETQLQKSACLSTGPISPVVAFPEWLKYNATDRHGETFTAEASGMPAALLLHEHLHNTPLGLVLRHQGVRVVNHVSWPQVVLSRSQSAEQALDWPQQYSDEQITSLLDGRRPIMKNPTLLAVAGRAQARAEQGGVLLG